MRFRKLEIRDWRQFAHISLSFHERLTVIAGANGAGKSTLLRILAQHFGFQNSLLATPVTRNGIRSYLAGIFPRKGATDSNQMVGEIKYSNNIASPLIVPEDKVVQYNIYIPNTQSVLGLFINSHRPVNIYQQVASIPTNAINAEQAYQAYNQEVQNKYNNSYSQYSPTYRIKEAIMSMATFGPGNANVQKNEVLERNYNDFKEMLSKVLPASIGFVDISIRIPDVVIVTRSGEFVIDASSGGLMALIDLAYQIFLYSRDKSEFVIVLDEPENHLHPSMQRIILTNLLEAFPNAQMVVATHSPFVVSSVKDSAVYVLNYGDGDFSDGASRKVYSTQLDNVNKAGTAGDILRSVLGVPVTIPMWAEDEIDVITSQFKIDALDVSSIEQLRGKLEAAGLGDYYADALGKLTRQK